MQYLLLFLSAFLAATLLPAQSEALLAGLLHNGDHITWLLISVASLGNILGSVFNWLLGRFLEKHRGHRYFPFKESALEKAQTTFQRYGWWSLLLSWVPVIGDPLTFVAGVMRMSLWSFIGVVAIAKTSRYLLLAWLVL